MCVPFTQVKVLYIRNLRSDVNEAQLKEKFESYGPIERVKRVKSYGFVHFSTRELALKAMDEMNGMVRSMRSGNLQIMFNRCIENCI